jgi:hypothetical protein
MVVAAYRDRLRIRCGRCSKGTSIRHFVVVVRGATFCKLGGPQPSGDASENLGFPLRLWEIHCAISPGNQIRGLLFDQNGLLSIKPKLDELLENWCNFFDMANRYLRSIPIDIAGETLRK